MDCLVGGQTLVQINFLPMQLAYPLQTFTRLKSTSGHVLNVSCT